MFLYRFLDVLNKAFDLLNIKKTFIKDLFLETVSFSQICNNCNYNQYDEETEPIVNLPVPEEPTESNTDLNGYEITDITEYQLLDLINIEFNKTDKCYRCNQEGGLRRTKKLIPSDILTFKIARDEFFPALVLPVRDSPQSSSTRSKKKFKKTEIHAINQSTTVMKLNTVSFPLSITSEDLVNYIDDKEKIKGPFIYDLFSVVHYDWFEIHYFQYNRFCRI